MEKKILQVPEESINGWQVPLALLEKATRENIWKNANASIVLSNHYVRYQMLPPSEDALDEEEQQALLHHLFTQTYGAAALQWEYRLSENTKESPGIACAIDRELLTALQQTCKNARLRLRSLQPYLSLSFNLMRREAGNRAGWLCVVEPFRFSAVFVRKGSWKTVVNRRLEGNDSILEIVARLERESLLAGFGDESRAVMFYGPDMQKPSAKSIGKWKVTRFEIPRQHRYIGSNEPGYALIAGG